MSEGNNNNSDKDKMNYPEVKHEAPRARNRTVMLSSDIAGEMRARLSEDFSEQEEDSFAEQVELPEVDLEEDNGFSEPVNLKGQNFYQPVVKPEEQAHSHMASIDDERRLRNFTANPNPGFTKVDPVAHVQPFADTVSNQGHVDPSILKRNAVSQILPHHHSADVVNNSKDSVSWLKQSPLLGFLVSYDTDPNGVAFELRSGRLIVTSEVTSGGNYLLICDESVSPMHAILKAGENGEVQVLDQLSENGTEISLHQTGEQLALSGDKGIASHGDTISFGNRTFHVCLVSRK
ncbi:MAG: FHA domain-containing protein [Bdellovibrionales bacterium]|nr:FHA domain-containing protein [Bdellovibrionales bacterium]